MYNYRGELAKVPVLEWNTFVLDHSEGKRIDAAAAVQEDKDT